MKSKLFTLIIMNALSLIVTATAHSTPYAFNEDATGAIILQIHGGIPWQAKKDEIIIEYVSDASIDKIEAFESRNKLVLDDNIKIKRKDNYRINKKDKANTYLYKSSYSGMLTKHHEQICENDDDNIVVFVSPIFEKAGSTLTFGNRIILKFKKDTDQNTKEELFKRYKFKVLQIYFTGAYLVATPNRDMKGQLDALDSLYKNTLLTMPNQI